MFKYLKIKFVFIIALLASLSPLYAGKISTDEIKRLQNVNETLINHISIMEEEFEASPSLNKYKKEYLSAIPTDSILPVANTVMAKTIAGAPFVFLGDEHTTPQSQRNTISVLQMMKKNPAPLTLVIEWIDISYQKEINNFLQGKIKISDLRKCISFDKYWGFSWANYSKILGAAKKLKTPILLTERLKNSHSLSDRDTFIVKKILEHRESNPKMRYLVVYGDYHILGKLHLSEKAAKAGLKPQLLLLGGASKVYWKLLNKIQDPDKTSFAKLSRGIFYIRNGTPLERNLSYRNYLLKILGYSKDDFDIWVDKRDILPISVSTNRFDSLHSTPAR